MERTAYNRNGLGAALLALGFCAAVMIPNAILFFTEPYSIWSRAALLMLPAGCYLLWSVAFRRSGAAVWLGFPVIFFCALQIVLLYLFGNSVAATDMFINIVTTNPGEATELLSNIYPSVIIVCIIYLPLLWGAFEHLRRKIDLAPGFRRRTAAAGCVLVLAGAGMLVPAYHAGRRILHNEIFPVNVAYNVTLCVREYGKIKNYDRTSAGFTYGARRTARADKREIYVYVIGEASRAANWELYGYDRPTNPCLKAKRDEFVLFRNMLSQSNTTHKCVPMILSSVGVDEHDELFRRKGLPALFNEAGFHTWFLSNQSPQGAMIDNLARDADSLIYLTSNPRYDMQLLDTMKRIIAADTADNLLIILHCYGSHFSYHQRYPREAAYFLPDDDVAIKRQHKRKIWNAYDNSIRYTDAFLSALIDYLASLDACSALLYSSDHGEDMLDDDRERFLHASPTTTCWQLHVASLAWFSDDYRRNFPVQAAAAAAHADTPATTHALFQTIADIASIEGAHVDRKASLTSPLYDTTVRRCYLNDHNCAVPFPATGLDQTDLDYFRRRGIEL